MSLNGGYAMIKHDATQEELAVAYKTKRPILLYDEDKRAHWAQINEKVIETVDEETEETIITYEYSYQLLNAIEALVDDSGNPRFIEGDGTPATITGFTSTYCKWSLSGTHLMIVLVGTMTGEITVQKLVSFSIPDWCFNKIYPIGLNDKVEKKTITLYSQSIDTVISLEISMIKNSNDNTIDFNLETNFNRSQVYGFRVQFDLLIDNE